MREKDRRLTVLPRFAKSKTATLLPNRVHWWMESAEPSAMKLRSDKLLPK
jgi:hypothetical protein